MNQDQAQNFVLILVILMIGLSEILKDREIKDLQKQINELKKK